MVSRRIAIASGALTLGALWLAPARARADATGWASVSGGAALVAADPEDGSDRLRSQLAFDTGVGTSYAAPIVVGGLFRVAPTIEEHTDFVFSLRGATSGFQTGPFGVALDAGFYARADDEASIGFVGGPVFGGPLGLQLAVTGHVGTTDELGASALLGVDLLRLSIHRESLLEWWPNPLPPERDVATR